jgi:hypothetical protein
MRPPSQTIDRRARSAVDIGNATVAENNTAAATLRRGQRR